VSSKTPDVGLAFLLSQVGAHAAACFEARLTAIGITPQHAGLLRMLGANPGMTQQAIAQLFGIFPSRLVVLLDELQGKKFLARRSTPTDRRSYQLHLTAAGKRCLVRIARITRELEKDLFRALNEAECASLSESLKRIVAQQEITPAVHPAYRTKTTNTKERVRS
jgi:DNA-binding MarR family transcriptional regulator